MNRFDSFEKMISWQRSREFNRKIYSITGSPDFRHDVDLLRQIRRASISISSNIAEGFERKSDKEFSHFLFIAKASAGELRSQVYLAYDLNYISKEIFSDLLSDITEISKLIGGLIRYLDAPKN